MCFGTLQTQGLDGPSSCVNFFWRGYSGTVPFCQSKQRKFHAWVAQIYVKAFSHSQNDGMFHLFSNSTKLEEQKIQIP
jgi:hypothetical protein